MIRHFLAAAFMVGSSSAFANIPKTNVPHGPYDAHVSVCFVPAQVCADSVVLAINAATKSIYVQAYGFTSPPILKALADAQKRGVTVQVILDKSNDVSAKVSDPQEGDDAPATTTRYTGAVLMTNAGIPVWIDFHPAIAHNKLITIDEHLVIGGSYNYTSSAEKRNAENVTFIDNAEYAATVIENWTSRQQASRKFVAPAQR